MTGRTRTGRVTATRRMEPRVVHGTLYRRIPTMRPAVDRDTIPFEHDAAVYGVYELPVTW